jgi:hypothetical protein
MTITTNPEPNGKFKTREVVSQINFTQLKKPFLIYTKIIRFSKSLYRNMTSDVEYRNFFSQ